MFGQKSSVSYMRIIAWKYWSVFFVYQYTVFRQNKIKTTSTHICIKRIISSIRSKLNLIKYWAKILGRVQFFIQCFKQKRDFHVIKRRIRKRNYPQVIFEKSKTWHRFFFLCKINNTQRCFTLGSKMKCTLINHPVGTRIIPTKSVCIVIVGVKKKKKEKIPISIHLFNRFLVTWFFFYIIHYYIY